MIMRALILAGGQGERLRPLTNNIPKCMIKVNGKSILDRIIDLLIKNNILDIYISVGYLSDQIEQHIADMTLPQNVSIKTMKENRPLGTAGPIKNISLFNEENLLVINGDIITDIEIDSFLNFHLLRESLFTIATTEVGIELKYGNILLDTDTDTILEMNEKPLKKYLINTGIYIINQNIISYIPDNIYFDMNSLVSICLQNKVKIHPFYHKGLWMDIGNPEDLKKSKQLLKEIE